VTKFKYLETTLINQNYIHEYTKGNCFMEAFATMNVHVEIYIYLNI
jgi:hypothetical protein